MYNYRRRVRLLPTTTIEQLLPLRPNTVDATSSSPDMYDYRCQDREYLYRRREQLLSSTTRERLLPLRTGPLRKRTLRRYNAETTPVT